MKIRKNTWDVLVYDYISLYLRDCKRQFDVL